MSVFDKLFDCLPFSFHDGALLDAKYENDRLELYCFRNPPDPDGTDDPNTRYIKIRFYGVSDLMVYDIDQDEFIPYYPTAFVIDRDEYWAINGIDYLDYLDGYVVFGQCVKFKCTDLEVIAASSKELA